MTVPEYSRLQTLFNRVADLDPTQRQEVLQQECADDPGLRRELEELLAADAALRGTTVRAAAPRLIALAATAAVADPISGTRVGPYVVREALGSGGMGSVYRAERADDAMTQQVAIKFVRRELLSADTLRRFRLERELLAGFDHPHIARLFDAAELPDGTPYYVMEYIRDAVPITDWCDRQGLGLAARVRLFLDVCEAVRYAHAHLIVHRDIKPGNVQVSPQGVVKLLDFGIAKVMPGSGRAAADETATEQRFLSPALAAPEQLLGQATGIATDIYALGLLLHQLLVGALPQPIGDRSYAEFIREVVDRDPEPASARVRAGASIEAARLRGHASVAAHARALRGDYDLILAKALRRRPEDRYASVERFSDDLRAVLDGRPIGLRAGERWYQAARFLRRHALPVSLGATAALTAVGFGITATLQARALAKERDTAVAHERRAVLEHDRAEAVSRFLIGAFEAADPSQALGRRVTAQEIVEAAVGELQRNVEGMPDAVHLALADSLAMVSSRLDMFEQATLLTASTRERTLAGGPPDPTAQMHQAVREMRIAVRGGRSAGGDAARTVALRALRSGSPDLELRHELLLAASEVDAANGRWRDMLDVLQPLAAGLPADADAGAAKRRATVALNMARAHGALRDDVAAVAKLRQALDELGERPADEPLRVRIEQRLAVSLRHMGDAAAALTLAQRVVERTERLYGPAHTQTASALNLRANALKVLGDLPRIEADYARAEAIFRERLGASDPRVLSVRFNRIGIALDQGRSDAEIDRALQALIADAAAVLGPEHPNAIIFTLTYVWYLLRQERYREAEPLIERCIAASEKHAFPRGARMAESRVARAEVLLARGNVEGARAELELARPVVAREFDAGSYPALAVARLDRKLR